jgi:hypothetical protein
MNKKEARNEIAAKVNTFLKENVSFRTVSTEGSLEEDIPYFTVENVRKALEICFEETFDLCTNPFVWASAGKTISSRKGKLVKLMRKGEIQEKVNINGKEEQIPVNIEIGDIVELNGVGYMQDL